MISAIPGGFFTPTEAAAIGCVYLVSLGFAYRTITLRTLPPVLRPPMALTLSLV